MWCVLLMVLGSLGRNQLPTEVDTIEVNHTPRFTQVILWRWSKDYLRYDCDDYWLVHGDLQSYPTQHCGFWIANYRGKTYRSKQMIERWTENDPERDNARLFPQSLRCAR